MLVKLFKNNYFFQDGLVSNNIIWLSLEKITRLGINFIFIVYVANILGSQKLGILSYIFTIHSLLVVLAGFGLQSIVVQLLSTKTDKASEIITASMIILVITGILSIFCAAIIAYFQDSNEFPIGKYLLLISFPIILKFGDILIYWFEAHIKSKNIVKINLPILLLGFFTKIYFLTTGGDLELILRLHALELCLINIVLTFFFFKKVFQSSKSLLDKKIFIEIITRSPPLLFGALIVVLAMRIDVLMIQYLLNFSDLGVYTLAIRVMEAVFFIPMIVYGSMTPKFYLLHQENPNAYNHNLLIFFRGQLIFCICVCLFTFIFADFFISMLFGDNYSSVTHILKILILSTIPVFNGILSTHWFLMHNLQNLILIKNILSLILNISFNYYFISLFGIQGAALGTLLSYISVELFDLIFNKTRPLFFIKYFEIFKPYLQKRSL